MTHHRPGDTVMFVGLIAFDDLSNIPVASEYSLLVRPSYVKTPQIVFVLSAMKRLQLRYDARYRCGMGLQ